MGFNAKPFDASTAAGFRETAGGLEAAALAAQTSTVATKGRANGEAFRHLAGAKAARDLTGVDHGVSSMQQTAVTLAATCPLS